jgi:FAD/FMN-containing dehydrogenase/Fe-S oxidoreductase
VTTAVRSDSAQLQHELSAIVEGEVRFDPYSRALYSTDASIYQIEPVGVVIPRHTADVQAVIETCNRNGVAVLPRGGGTGLSGQTVNHAVVIDFSKYMHDILEINSDERWVRTQPGITLDELNRQIRPHGLMFTPDPSTSSRANVGGAMGNNSCGSHSIIYGKTVDHVLEMDVTLSDGSQTIFRNVESGALEAKLALSGLEGEIYRGVRDISARSAELVEARFPKILRRVGGYNIDRTNSGTAINLSELMVGSEGTLAAVTSARLNLVPIPKHKVMGVIHFNGLIEAMEATVAILDDSPAAVEHIGSMIINQARQSLGFARSLDFLQGEPSDVLVVEFSSDDEGEAKSKLDHLEARLQREKLGFAFTKLYEQAAQGRVIAMRQAGLGLMMNVPGDSKPLPFVEDTAVSPERLPEYVARFDEVVKKHGTEAGYYGHASVGCLHVRPLVNVKTSDGVQKLHDIASDIADLVKEFEGSMTGEHGDGIVRGYWTEKMFGPELTNSFRDVKRTFDPNGIMNPGKIFDTPDIKENLRFGPEYKVETIETRLDFTEEEGFAAAIEKCNGVGACRKLNAGAMCPSYMATHEEEHTTRGRANALRAAMSGKLPVKAFANDQLKQILDLCIECKSCKSECPSNVDMAKIKYEFMYQYYKSHRVPLRSQIVGNIHRLNALAAPMAPLVNLVNRAPPTRWLLQRTIKISAARPMPPIVRNTFQKWFGKHMPNTTGSRGEVILFHDTFMNFNHPSVGIAATHLLEALGYSVTILKDRKCCSRPQITKGLLDQAGVNTRHNVDLMHPYVERGVKIVGCEASCVSAMTDDWPALLGNEPKAKAVAAAVTTVEELIVEAQNDGGQQIDWSNAEKEVQFFGHCHQRALTGTAPSVTALKLPPNFQTSEISAGCCGMAGSFGYESEHIDVAVQMGEDRLFPAVRSARSNVEVATTGISCREQIGFNTPKTSRHIVEILADALPD